MNEVDPSQVIQVLRQVGLINEVLDTYTCTYISSEWLIKVGSGLGDITVKSSAYKDIEVSLPLLVVDPESILPFLCLKNRVSGFLCVHLDNRDNAYITYTFLSDCTEAALKSSLDIAKKEINLLREMCLILATSIKGMEESIGEESTEDRLLNMILEDEDIYTEEEE
jgi:hypothetical protein